MINNEYIKLFKQICKLRPEFLLNFLEEFLKSQGYKNIIKKDDNYLIAEGEIPIALCAHVDTVASDPPENIFYDPIENVFWSPELLGGDDRAGIFGIMLLVLRGCRPMIIFTDQEEVGGLGAKALVLDYPKPPFGKIKAIIELDRHGSKDSVYYYNDNTEFESYINNFGFKTNYGTFSDISIIAPIWDCSAVNLSIGYYNEHSFQEFLRMDELYITVQKVQNILNKNNIMPYFNYIKMFVDYSAYKFSKHNHNQCGICNKEIKKNEKVYKAYGLEVCESCYKEYCI